MADFPTFCIPCPVEIGEGNWIQNQPKKKGGKFNILNKSFSISLGGKPKMLNLDFAIACMIFPTVKFPAGITTTINIYFYYTILFLLLNVDNVA